MGLYPALARMIYRNDISESPVLANRNVHVPSLAEGKMGFSELVQQGYDDKQFSGTVSPEMLAVGRFPVSFNEEYVETEIPDVSKYLDSINQLISSVTGELKWHYGEKKYVSVDTKGTKGMIGFAQNETIHLGDWQISTENPFAVILITDLSEKGDLATAERILVTAVGRALNSGMVYEYSGGETTLVHEGTSPLLMEPVKAMISLDNSSAFELWLLDHDGKMTSRKLQFKNGAFTIDGSQDKTMYYLIVKKE
jgi:hypothetical protein